MKDFNVASLIVGILSLAGVIVNICVTMASDKKRRYTGLITNHRISSLTATEKLFSNIIGSMYNFLIPSTDKVEEFKSFELNKQEALYMIGQEGCPDAEIREVLGLVEQLLFYSSVEKKTLTRDQTHKFYDIVKVGIDCLQSLTKAYTKCEWEKCKLQSVYGAEKSFNEKKVLNNFYIQDKEKVDGQIQFLKENYFQSIFENK